MSELVIHGPGNVSLYRGWAPEILDRTAEVIREWDRHHDATHTARAVDSLARTAVEIAEVSGRHPEVEARYLLALLKAYEGQS